MKYGDKVRVKNNGAIVEVKQTKQTQIGLLVQVEYPCFGTVIIHKVNELELLN